MKIFTLLLLSSLVFFTGYAQSKKKIRKNLVLSQTGMEYDADSETSSKEEFIKFNRNGETIEQIEYQNGKVTRHTKYQYDENDNKIEEVRLSPGGKIKKRMVYRYTDGGLKTERLTYDQNGKLLSRLKYVYEYYE